ncbi:MAG: hypothetical protein COC19_05805 [SAR86 cluster bacterium]|uniref:Uncharacterized protein n=1 Tax=SAR86 cluster bacterium TaxID=2030880 RepID=A0A2A4ML12_9GAMM|nr:MAG: hypothetical protein COC19_05805 [SAR86 cluster bacterium]
MSPLALLVSLAFVVLVLVMGFYGSKKQFTAKNKARDLEKHKVRVHKLNIASSTLADKYFPKSLKALVFACQLNSFEILNNINQERIIDEAQISKVKLALEELSQSPDNMGASNFKAAELKEFQYILKDLYGLIIELNSDGTLNQKNAKEHLDLIKFLILNLTVDTYEDAAKQAIASNNPTLAQHYYNAALQKLENSPNKDLFKEKIQKLSVAAAGLAPAQPVASESESTSEWDAVDAVDNQWQKKNF